MHLSQKFFPRPGEWRWTMKAHFACDDRVCQEKKWPKKLIVIWIFYSSLGRFTFHYLRFVRASASVIGAENGDGEQASEEDAGSEEGACGCVAARGHATPLASVSANPDASPLADPPPSQRQLCHRRVAKPLGRHCTREDDAELIIQHFEFSVSIFCASNQHVLCTTSTFSISKYPQKKPPLQTISIQHESHNHCTRSWTNHEHYTIRVPGKSKHYTKRAPGKGRHCVKYGSTGTKESQCYMICTHLCNIDLETIWQF